MTAGKATAAYHPKPREEMIAAMGDDRLWVDKGQWWSAAWPPLLPPFECVVAGFLTANKSKRRAVSFWSRPACMATVIIIFSTRHGWRNPCAYRHRERQWMGTGHCQNSTGTFCMRDIDSQVPVISSDKMVTKTDVVPNQGGHWS